MKSFLRLFSLYLCSGIYRSISVPCESEAACTGKLLDSLPRNNAVVMNSEWLTAVTKKTTN
jgi:hypothetical protein